MMKKTMVKIASACALVALVTISGGCSHLSVAHGDQKDLATLSNVATTVNSAIWVTYIGESESAIYIEYGTMAHPMGLISNKPKYKIYRFSKSELTPEMKKQFWWKTA